VALLVDYLLGQIESLPASSPPVAKKRARTA
jgi:hypothetical protein